MARTECCVRCTPAPLAVVARVIACDVGDSSQPSGGARPVGDAHQTNAAPRIRKPSRRCVARATERNTRCTPLVHKAPQHSALSARPKNCDSTTPGSLTASSCWGSQGTPVESGALPRHGMVWRGLPGKPGHAASGVWCLVSTEVRQTALLYACVETLNPLSPTGVPSPILYARRTRSAHRPPAVILPIVLLSFLPPPS